MVERKKYLDIMKFIGVCCLFLAHVQAPLWLEEFRGFDVTMMVFVSGILAVASIERVTSTSQYIFKRIKRLVVPTWIFLIIFYMAMVFIGQKPKLTDILKSFLFQRDCGLAGGVWIILVYLICAILAPILYKYLSNRWLMPILLFLFGIYEIIVVIIPSLVEVRFIYYSFFTCIPYGVILLLGMKTSEMTIKSKYFLCCFTFVIHIIIGVFLFLYWGKYVSVSQFKYPARLYYLTYGIPVAIILMILFAKLEGKIPDFKLIRFVSEHSLWIYLWQIMMLTIVNYVIKISDRWFLSWCFLMGGSILVTWIQNIIINGVYKKTKLSFLMYFKG